MFNHNPDNVARQQEISAKLIEMGHALMTEGKEKKDYVITQTGTNLVMLGGLMLDEQNVSEFSTLTSMYSSKLLLDSIERENPDALKHLRGSENESYEDFIKRINKLRGDNGLGPISE